MIAANAWARSEVVCYDKQWPPYPWEHENLEPEGKKYVANQDKWKHTYHGELLKTCRCNPAWNFMRSPHSCVSYYLGGVLMHMSALPYLFSSLLQAFYSSFQGNIFSVYFPILSSWFVPHNSVLVWLTPPCWRRLSTMDNRTLKDLKVSQEELHLASSASFLAETPLRSPPKLFIFIL